MLKEFKEFAVKGNVVDMGVGIVIGAAFTTIVKSFVDDIVNPILGIFTGGIDFSGLYLNLSGQEVASATQAKEDGLAVITYGVFINACISFLIVAWVLFFVVRAINRLKKELEPPTADTTPPGEPEPPADVKLLSEIRDLLKERSA
ncbi:large conductance mechanosensitive channel protein MscL [Albimonas sp. CAU 1670]|uniref:large conductance mechanosensitive channel protein MscL n=1 Tax=Albimonas sp. CAU 1670 TaxID=3032599 RepID=UPI0023DC0217|nr:large conductance mechanosensitive channel protein MscL [Albimonas sp. CAU 1670]MDF2233932.1 large conductance mechanosensitive channel protein MscL [Albimonas sp. CAU 1670]